MADPLSVVASTLAVVGAAEGATKTLLKFKKMLDGPEPEHVLALINEISDLRIVLTDIQKFLVRNTVNLPQQPLRHVATLIDRAKAELLQLDELIQYRLFKANSVPGRIKVSRREWVKSNNKLERFRQEMRDIRLNLVTQILTINL